MTDFNSHREFVETTRIPPEVITRRNREIYTTVLESSSYLDDPNFTEFHPHDLRRLFDECDWQFFGGRCREMLGDTELRFRISLRMTKAGGKTTLFVHRDGSRDRFFEIAVSSTLLFQTFHEPDRPIAVTGIECRVSVRTQNQPLICG